MAGELASGAEADIMAFTGDGQVPVRRWQGCLLLGCLSQFRKFVRGISLKLLVAPARCRTRHAPDTHASAAHPSATLFLCRPISLSSLSSAVLPSDTAGAGVSCQHRRWEGQVGRTCMPIPGSRQA